VHIEIPGRMPILLGFGAENQFDDCFFLASISCVFCPLDFSIETLIDWNRGRRHSALRRSGRSQLLGDAGRPPCGQIPSSRTFPIPCVIAYKDIWPERVMGRRDPMDVVRHYRKASTGWRYIPSTP
jgi:hypothetical protein